MENKIKLGDKVRDKVTGFEGTVTEYMTCLTGTDRCYVESSVDNKFQGIYIDYERLETIE